MGFFLLCPHSQTVHDYSVGSCLKDPKKNVSVDENPYSEFGRKLSTWLFQLWLCHFCWFANVSFKDEKTHTSFNSPNSWWLNHLNHVETICIIPTSGSKKSCFETDIRRPATFFLGKPRWRSKGPKVWPLLLAGCCWPGAAKGGIPQLIPSENEKKNEKETNNLDIKYWQKSSFMSDIQDGFRFMDPAITNLTAGCWLCTLNIHIVRVNRSHSPNERI